jgi:hypothetical protein
MPKRTNPESVVREINLKHLLAELSLKNDVL